MTSYEFIFEHNNPKKKQHIYRYSSIYFKIMKKVRCNIEEKRKNQSHFDRMLPNVKRTTHTHNTIKVEKEV